MIVSVECPNPDCRKRHKIDDSLFGQTATCRKCGRVFVLSGPVQTVAAGGQTETRNAAAPVVRETSRGVREQLGRFRIVSRLGGGAFGTVYRALDPVLGREVALKVPRAAALESPEARARFLREPKAAAHLRHPNIVPIYDAGTDGDDYYIASAFIEGRTLAEVLEDRRPDFRRAAEILRRLAEGLDYAHRNGVVHRDVKPSNVMLDARGEPLLMDFGLARLESSEEKLTQDGTVMGTPAYMAPEQADGSLGEVGPASDQYSLGVVLYELLCGEPPFGGPPAVLLFNVVHQEPPSPRSRDARIPRDLETICLKAMAKRSADRYASCAELAEDLRRWLADEPIRARRMGLAERWMRWCRRNPALAGVSAVATLLLLSVAATATVGYVREAGLREETERALAAAQEAEGKAATASEEAETERQAAFRERDAAEEARRREAASAAEADRQRLAAEHERDAAEEARRKETAAKEEADRQRQVAERERAVADKVRKEAEANLYLVGLAFAQQNLAAENAPLAEEHLDACPADLRGWEWDHLKYRCRDELITIAGHGGPVSCAVFSSDGRWIATGGVDKAVKIWNAIDGQAVKARPELPAGVSSLAFSPDGTRLVAATFDGSIHVWDLKSEEKFFFQAHGKGVCAVAFSPDGKSFASGGGDQTLKLWDGVTGEEIRTFDGVAHPVRCVAFTPNGRAIAAAGMVWAVDGSFAMTFETDAEEFYAVAVRPDGKQIAWGTIAKDPYARQEHAVIVCDVETRKQTRKLRGYTDKVNAVAFIPDGTRIVSGSADGTIKLWDTATNEEVITFREHTAAVNSLAFSPGGRRLVSASSDGTVKVFGTAGRVYRLGDDSRGLSLESARFSPDARQLTVAGAAKIMIWENSEGRWRLAQTKPLPKHSSTSSSFLNLAASQVAFSDENRAVLVVWDIAAEREVFRSDPPSQGGELTWFGFSPDGGKIAAIYVRGSRYRAHENEVRVWDLCSGATVFTFGAERVGAGGQPMVTFAPDGSKFAFWSAKPGPLCLFDAATGKEIGRSEKDWKSVPQHVFSPDGQHVLFLSGELMRLPSEGQPMRQVGTLPVGSNRGTVVFSADGTRIARNYYSEVRIFRTESFLDPVTIKVASSESGRVSYVDAMALSGDGTRLATLHRGILNLWDAGTGKLVLGLRGLPSNLPMAAFSPDGQWMVIASDRTNEALMLCDVSEEQPYDSSSNGEAATAVPSANAAEPK